MMKYEKDFSKKQRRLIRKSIGLCNKNAYSEHEKQFLEQSKDKVQNLRQSAPVRLERCEFVLQNRTSRLILVLDRCVDVRNQEAMFRTAELYGLQHVWCVRSCLEKNSRRITKGADQWLTVRFFEDARDCAKELSNNGYTIWLSDVQKTAVRLDHE
eukprot:UN25316